VRRASGEGSSAGISLLCLPGLIVELAVWISGSRDLGGRQ
jgi:hypothetical protein